MGVEFEQGKPVTKKFIDFVYKATHTRLKEDSGISIKSISISASRKIVKAAFEYALANGRKKVTAVHKANIMKFSDGLFSSVAREVAQAYQGKVEFEERLVDNMCMQLVQKPQNYDVLVLPNLYGDIISDLCAGLVGGLGVAPGANIGDRVNPTGMILSGVMMLRWLNEVEAANKLENALAEVIREGKKVTYDFKPTSDDPTAVGTREMGEAVIEKLLQS